MSFKEMRLKLAICSNDSINQLKVILVKKKKKNIIILKEKRLYSLIFYIL
jgi:hypothetical protein